MPYEPFATAAYVPSTTPPTAFATASYAPSTTPPTTFGNELLPLADVAALKAIPTVDLDPAAEGAAPIVRQVTSATAGEVVQVWQLLAGVHADDVANGYAQPADYDADTNAKHWRRVL